MTQRAVELAGGLSAVSGHFNISYEAVRQWVANDKIPADRVVELEMLIDSQITRHDLRPDIFGEAPKDAA